MEALLLLVFVAPSTTPQASEEFKRLSGTWEVVRAEENGKEVDREKSILPAKVRFTDVKPKWIEKRCDIYTITLDSKADPVRITATVAGGEIRGERMLGIYRLEKDRLTLRLHYGATEFPTGFKTADTDGTYLLELRRLKE